jgi:phospholipase C
VVVVMKENRSFDELLGRLPERGQPDSEPIPRTFVNLDARGFPVAPFHETSTCVPQDPGHQWTAAHDQIDDGKMDGFVRSAAATTGTDGHFVMGGFDAPDLPFYYFLARTFALDDRHFASARTGTYPNRLFMLLGTPDGVVSTGAGYPSPRTPTIFGALDAAHVSWGAYSDGSLLGGALGWSRAHARTGSFAAFLAALDDGSLPSVAFVDGVDDVTDEHPPADVQKGEQWTRIVYEHAVASPLWPRLAMVWTYDEAGGFADHVPPPPACEPRDVAQDEAFNQLGERVPFVVVSPWARPHHVSHVPEDHTAITRFIEVLFDLPALTSRDANSGALLDLFDFVDPPALLEPPRPPPAGFFGCSPP